MPKYVSFYVNIKSRWVKYLDSIDSMNFVLDSISPKLNQSQSHSNVIKFTKHISVPGCSLLPHQSTHSVPASLPQSCSVLCGPPQRIPPYTLINGMTFWYLREHSFLILQKLSKILNSSLYILIIYWYKKYWIQSEVLSGGCLL